MFRLRFDGLWDIIFPRNCILCRQHLSDNSYPLLCPQCYHAIEFNAPPFCLKCSRHMPVFSPDGFCTSCHRDQPTFDFAWAAVQYTPIMQQLIHLYKYHDKTLLRKLFGFLLMEFMERYRVRLEGFDVLIPIPLHAVRQRERGYNQAALIAEILAEHLHLPVDTTSLVRVKNTPHLALSGRKDRWTNIQGAFRIRRPENITGKSVVIIDDLLTTGATASQAAAEIKQAGAKSVAVVTLAIAD